MNTHHITSVISLGSANSNIFKGVFARNHFIDQCISYPSIYIINTDNSNQSGSQWTGVYFSIDHKCQYFDSYGIPPLFNDVVNKLRSIDSTFVYNSYVLQSLNTNVCGIYCIVFAIMKCKGYSLKDIIDLFLLTNNDDERDHALRYFMDRNFSLIISTFGHLPPIHDVSNEFSFQTCKFKSQLSDQ